MARLSVILVGAALAIVFLVPLGAPKAAAATVPVSLYQRNFQFHVGNQFAAERNIALNVGDRIELRVENKDSTVTHTFTSTHFPQDTTNAAQDLSDAFLSLNVTNAGTPGAVVFWNYTVVAGDKGVWEYHCKPHVGGGMFAFFYIGQPTLSILSPSSSATVSTTGFRTTVDVQGFTLDAERIGLANVTGHGHIHFFEDGNPAGLSASPVFDFGTLAPGSHTIRAELYTNAHWPLLTPIFDEITVTAGNPEITILEPVAGATVSNLSFRVRVAVHNFTLDELGYGGPNVPGQGHWHVNKVAPPNSPLLAAVATETAILGTQSVGALTLNVSLHNNDHSALVVPGDTRLYQVVTVQVAAPSIVASAPASIVSGGDLVITWTVSGFVLDNAAFGGAPEVGRGHVHVFDTTSGSEVYKGATAGTSWTFSGLSVGNHTFKVELYNNDHSELPAEYSSTVTVVVNAPATTPPTTPAGVSTNVFYGSVIVLIIIIVALIAMLVRKGRSGMKTPPSS